VNSLARSICALAVVAGALGAAPPAKYGPVPKSPQTAVAQKYVDALRDARYNDAFAMLVDDERKYFGDAASFRSVFDADGITIRNPRLVGARGDDRGRVFFVRETLGFVDHASDKHHELPVTIPIGVLPEHGTLHVKDPGKPYRAFASDSSVSASGLRVTVKKVDFFPDRIAVIVTFANVGDNFVTLLPYGKSVLRDDKGGVYRILALKNWSVTDKQLYQGVPLAPNAQYTGSLAFSAQRLGGEKRAWSLTLAPQLREGADAPFDVTVPIVPRS
jgi:hypothetical protein